MIFVKFILFIRDHLMPLFALCSQIGCKNVCKQVNCKNVCQSESMIMFAFVCWSKL